MLKRTSSGYIHVFCRGREGDGKFIRGNNRTALVESGDDHRHRRSSDVYTVAERRFGGSGNTRTSFFGLDLVRHA